ncbi:LytR family transcriptional regulator [Rhodococcus sp. Leaf278]|uniref:LCP family protein n=1 Tax=Rhodococcus sp. Leaf278 TaxID=1736319 RepID=UPI00070EB76E|nr:LytR family transcriptional regulator [Rhodococcus sp. Leaf278]
MGDDRESGPSVPEGRAPWERPLSSIRQNGEHRPRSERPSTPDQDSPPQPGDSGRLGKRSPRNADTVSVAELVDKMSRSGSSRRAPTDRPETEEPTEIIAPITDATPPPSRAVPPTPPHAVPEPVGAPASDRPALTRLAMSRVRRRRRLRMIGRSLVSVIAVLSVALTGVVWGYLRNTDQGFLQVAALDPDSTDVVDAAGQYGDETYLIVGTDTRTGASGEVGAGTVADAEGARSDTVMLVNIPADRSRVVAVSFPRDLDVTRPECEQFDNDTNTYTGEMFPEAYGDKLNATYALGGPKCLVKTIQKISGLRIGHFVGMDFAGFESMVDEVGGVEVCTAQPLFDYELGDVLPNPGTQRIDGRTALNYVRARNIESEGNGDYGRIKRQQRFLSSLLRSALSNQVLLDPGKLNGFVNAFTSDTFVENVKTQDLVTLGRSLQNVDAGAVTFLTIPTTGTNDYGNEIPNEDAIGAIFQAIIDDDPLPGEERADPVAPESSAPPAVPAAPLLAVEPGTVSLQVSNASDIAGMAQTASDELATYGFQILTVGNFSGSATQTVVRYSQDQEAAAATVASAIPGAAIELAPSLNNVVEVVLGSNYPGYTQSPTPFGTVVDATQVEGSIENTPLPEDLSFTNAADDTCA